MIGYSRSGTAKQRETSGTYVPCLYFSPSVRLCQSPLHGRRYAIGVQDGPARLVPRCPADRLQQGRVTPKKPLGVCVQDTHQGHLRKVETLGGGTWAGLGMAEGGGTRLRGVSRGYSSSTSVRHSLSTQRWALRHLLDTTSRSSMGECKSRDGNKRASTVKTDGVCRLLGSGRPSCSIGREYHAPLSAS